MNIIYINHSEFIDYFNKWSLEFQIKANNVTHGEFLNIWKSNYIGSKTEIEINSGQRF